MNKTTIYTTKLSSESQNLIMLVEEQIRAIEGLPIVLVASMYKPLDRFTIAQMIKIASEALGTPQVTLFSEDRQPTLVSMRQALMYIIRMRSSYSLKEIALAMGKDHTTIIHGCKAFGDKLSGMNEMALEYLLILTNTFKKIAEQEAAS